MGYELQFVPGCPCGATLKVSIISSQASVAGLPMWVAKEQGFFEDHGLEPDFLTDVTTGPAITSALVSGSAHVVT